MDKSFIARIMIKKSKYTDEQKRLLNDIEKAREDLISTREYLNYVKDPRLVDYAIFKEEAAKARYMFLLSEAKESQLQVECLSSIEELGAG